MKDRSLDVRTEFTSRNRQSPGDKFGGTDEVWLTYGPQETLGFHNLPFHLCLNTLN